MNVRNTLIVINVLVIVAMGVIAVIILRRHRDEERAPANQTEFYDDEVLEGRRLERVLGWALITSAVIAISLPVYWLREPTRQEETIEYFDDRSVERGKELYANSTFEEFDAAVSLQCANCHGADGAGGSAPAVFTDPDTGDVEQVFWSAPALDTVLLRFSPEEVTQVLNYGRPGSPMQAFGTPGGGPKNEQSIEDIVNYLASIQLTPAEAQARAADALEAARTQAEDQLSAAETALRDAETALADAERDPESTAAEIAALEDDVESAAEALEWAEEWLARRTDVTDGQLLYELSCARCHTKGWSIFDPSRPNGDNVLGAAGGGGTLGFNLRDGATQRRFPSAADHADFIASGSELNVPYGDGGQGSGRMPGFGVLDAEMLTPEMIESIVEYEREGLAENDPSEPAAIESSTTEGS